MNSAFISAALGSAVEFFETIAIAYAILRAGYPREAVSATILGHVVIFALAFALYPIHDLLPIFWFRLAAAILLTTMGLNWSIKSIRRTIAHKRPKWATDPLAEVGIEPAQEAPTRTFSWFIFAVMLKSSVVEAFEILLVVFPIAAASDRWASVLTGASAGIVIVLVVALFLHGQLRRVPEVIIKLVTGLILTAIGVSWLLELLLET